MVKFIDEWTNFINHELSICSENQELRGREK